MNGVNFGKALMSPDPATILDGEFYRRARRQTQLKPFNRAEKPLEPWFNHVPSEFGIPDGYTPEQPNKRVNPDAQAVPGSAEIREALDKIEQQYEKWASKGLRLTRPVRRLIRRIARKPLTWFREQFKITLTAYTKAIGSTQASETQIKDAQQVGKIVADYKDLRLFMLTYFKTDLEGAEATGKPLLGLCKEIMLRAAAVKENPTTT